VLDLRALRADPEVARSALRRRGADGALDELLTLDAAARRLRGRVEEGRAERARVSKAIGAARRAGGDASAEEAAARALATAVAEEEEELRELEARRDALLSTLPNLPDPRAPDGGEDDARELRRVGEPPALPFAPRDHVELATAAGALDLEQAAKVSGARFAYLLGPLVRVQTALVAFALDRLEAEGFVPVVPPVLVREEAMWGTGFFPTDRASVYSTAEDDLFLVGTSEVPLAGLHAEQILAPTDLPLRYAGVSTCFRREAGAAGRDTRGIFRVHQFDKVEMFAFVATERSVEEHERLVAIQEGILRSLGIAYRAVDIAVGDLGAPAARKIDLEAWMAGQGRYREVTSCSNCTDYQARRMRCRVRGERGTEVVHTLNGTAVAVGRTIIALLEGGQREDGSVALPEVLHAYGAPAEIRPGAARPG
jgi:seryl-tRNA synthetase